MLDKRFFLRSVAVGVFASSIILLEVLLTRIFSVTFYSHMAFVSVSLGMLGLSASGISTYLRPLPKTDDELNGALSINAFYFAGTAILADIFCSKTGVSLERGTIVLYPILISYVASFLPFYFGGKILALLFACEKEKFARLYAVDLISASLSCLLYGILIRWLGGPSAILFVALMAGGAGFILFSNHRKEKIRLAGICLVAVGILFLDFTYKILSPTNAKSHLYSKTLFEGWNTFSRVAVYDQSVGPWALSPLYKGMVNSGYLMDIDASASTMVTPKGDNSYLLHELTASAYTVAPKNKGLVIGSGGGRDIATALLFGMKHVDAVEINPIIVNDIGRKLFADYNGHLYDDPRVSYHIEDGRTFTRGSSDQYDLIQMSLIDTWAATAAGAFALSENNLYTVEAAEDYISHLSPNGVLTLVRWSGDDILRLVGILFKAGQNLKIEDMAQHIVIVEGPASADPNISVSNIIFRRSKFDKAALEVLEKSVSENGFKFVFNPRTADEGPLGKIISSTDPGRAIFESSQYEMRPSTDDWPFFFFRPDKHPWENIKASPLVLLYRGEYLVLTILVFSTLLGLLVIFFPLLMHSQRVTVNPGTSGISSMFYFACIGVGFMFVEMGLMQRSVLYLGHPSHALATVLSGLLLGTGCGAWAMSKLKGPRVFKPEFLAICTGVAVAVFNPLQLWVYSKTQGLSVPSKIIIAEALLIPFGFFLGTLMPTGIDRLTKAAPAWVPWAWGVNGLASVLGSSAAIYVAMQFGFFVTLVAGALIYFLGSAVARFLPQPAVR